MDLLTSDGQLPTTGRVTGALGVDARTGEYTAFEARVAVMATGPIHFPYPRPDGPFTGGRFASLVMVWQWPSGQVPSSGRWRWVATVSSKSSSTLRKASRC